ncbi:MAG: hypothetical protein WCJ24_00775 [Candidatus Saccharibacteria bacterium]
MSVAAMMSEGPGPDERKLGIVHSTRPPQKADVFILQTSPLPTFGDISIDLLGDPIPRPDLDTRFVNYYQLNQHFSDGTRARGVVGIALNPISDLPIVGEPAWFTSLDRGFNQRTSDRLGELGRHTYRQGVPNQGHSLYRNSWDVHLALGVVAQKFEDKLQTTIIDAEGDSNGAMTSTGVIAYSEAFDRVVRDGYFVDPCMVSRIGLEEALKFLKHPEYIAKEAYCLFRQAIRLINEEEDATSYIKTIELSTEYIIGNALLPRALFWGDLGHLIAHIPETQKAHYRLFEHSIGNQKRKFHKILRGPNGTSRQAVTTEVITGTHLSIANPKTINAKLEYFRNQTT